MPRSFFIFVFLLVCCFLSACSGDQFTRNFAQRSAPSSLDIPFDSTHAITWPVTGGNWKGHRYSPLTDITKDNVSELEIAWIYRHGDVDKGSWIRGLKNFTGTAFEATPILVEGLLIFSTPFNRVIALNPSTGEEIWTYDPEIHTRRRYANAKVSRGVEYWSDPDATGLCSGRIFLGTLDARLIALDVKTGQPCRDFGNDSVVNLLEGLDPLIDKEEYNLTSPPAIAGDRVIVGSSIADIVRHRQPPGHVRAFDARSGDLVWQFNTIPQEGEFGTDTWHNNSWKHTGGANVWAPMTVDRERNMVFLPVSAAGPDFYGMERKGMNLFANSVVALNANTGDRIWHFQTVHHDLWDHDVASPPLLATLNIDDTPVDAVIQVTKLGLVFVLDRETGIPLFPVTEQPVPASDMPGEETWPTQPFPEWPPALIPHTVEQKDLWDLSPKHLEACSALLSSLRNEGIYTPPSARGSILIPGNSGGANWAGAGWNPMKQTLYVPVNHLPMTIRLQKLPDKNQERENRKVLAKGPGALIWAVNKRGTGLRYYMDRRLFAHNDRPCVEPPWGYLVAIDFQNQTVSWKVPTGVDEDGFRGVTTAGPVLVTASGLVFHGGATDQRLWVYDAETGETLTHFDLPAGLHAGPITYKLHPEGKQLLVIAPGGHVAKESPLGDYVIAYVLPDS